jgi:hypothetical protein
MLIFRNCADVQINSLVGAYPPNAFQNNVRTAYTKKEVRTRTLYIKQQMTARTMYTKKR